MKTYGNIILMTVICIVIFWVFMALRPASAQQFIGGSGDYGRRHSYQRSSITWTPQEAACYRANYASTFAMQRCTDQVLARLAGPKRSRR